MNSQPSNNYQMRRFILIFFVLPTALCAAPVSPNVAQQVAQKFLDSAENSNTMTRAMRKQRNLVRHNIIGDDSPHYYIFNSSSNDGFVIVSGDDCATPILGYSTEGCIDLSNIPVQLEDLLQVYSDEIQYAIDNNILANDSVKALWTAYLKAPMTQKAAASVNALISTRWDQSPYYNNKCPFDASLSQHGGHPTTGCVATAMAQIMKYWEYPTQGIGNKSYPSQRYGTLSANFANTTYDWSNMPIQLSSSTSSTQNNAVATLMYHCGVGVSMDYNSDGDGSSGAQIIDLGFGRSSAEMALRTYFGYASTVVGKRWTANISSNTWKNMLKNELDNQRPILYAGFSTSGGGHAFVCDGYDSNDMFHFNWGWGGTANGFFSLTALTPGNHNYTYNQQAVIGIKPSNGSGPAKNYDLYMNTDLSAINTSSTSSSLDVNPYYFGNTISFAAKIENNGTGIFNGVFRVATFTNEGEFIAWSKELYHISLGAGRVTERNVYTFDGGAPFVPGKYRAYMYYKDDNESDWKPVKTDEGIILTEYNNVAFTIKSSSTDLKPTSSFNIERGDFTTGSRIRIEVDIKNTALFTIFYGKVRLCLYSTDCSLAQVIDELDYSTGFSPNTTQRLSFYNVVDVEPGSYYLALTYKESNQTTWHYMGCIDSYSNPVRVIVHAPALIVDDYEDNNKQTTATLLSWSIDQEIADFGTLQVSLHDNSDVDYYKLLFPNNCRYRVTVNLYDKYNNNGGWYENADAQFAYSLGGTSFSNNNKNSQTITFNGPTTLYLRVTQYGLNGLGFYELSGDIEESIDDAINDVEMEEHNKTTKILRNNQIYIKRGSVLYTLTGVIIE